MKTGKSFIRLDSQMAGFDEVTADLLTLTKPSTRKLAIEAGGLAALYAVKNYYSTRGGALWENSALPTHGEGREKTQWWRQVEGGWQVKSSTTTGVTMSNKTVGLAHKITGGTITPKRRKFLTIPLIPQAHGKTAKEFSRKVSPLFIVKGTLAMRGEDGQVIPVFALKKSVTHKPWQNALPQEETYLKAFAKSALEALEDAYEQR